MSTVSPTVSLADAAAAVKDGDVHAEVTTTDGTVIRLAKPLQNDVWIYRIIVGVLGGVILSVVGGTLALKLVDSRPAIPDVLVAIGTGALGALAGLLAPTPGSGGSSNH